jgi:glycosyltransferase involved in cell wall biosynthesis
MAEVHFLLAGKGVDRGNAKLLQGIEESDLHGFTHLLGLRTDVPRLMAARDVLVSSSIGEAFPNVLGEAMGCCVPCAVTDVGDSAWIVGDTGWVVPVGDMAGLAKAMEELLAMPPAERKILGERARTRVSEKFEIGNIVEQYKVFYAELAALGQRRRDH